MGKAHRERWREVRKGGMKRKRDRGMDEWVAGQKHFQFT